MNIIPLYSQVIVEPITIEQKTQSGIILVENSTSGINAQLGRVIAVGHGMITPEGGIVPLQVKKGDKVLFVRGTGQIIKTKPGTEYYLVFKENELLGIVQD